MPEMNQPETEASQPVESSETDTTTSANSLMPLRIWPPLLLLVGMLVTRSLPLLIETDSRLPIMATVFGPLLFGGLILIWWLFASRASLKEKLIGTIVVIAAAAVTYFSLDPTMMGPGIMLITAPMGFGLFGISAVLVSRWLSLKRTVIIVLCSVLGFGFSTLLRSNGMWGDFNLDLAWRWVPSAEDRMLASDSRKPKIDLNNLVTTELDQSLNAPEWPAFRGNQRDGALSGVSLSTEWGDSVKTPLWKIPVGPGWSSFVVAGDLLFTQEQRGESEAIVCYDANSGGEVWIQEINSRFYDPLGGPGPRATPTLANGQLFVIGANGDVMRLDPKTGEIIWQQDLRKVAKRKPPGWGFSSSPLVVDSLVVVHAGGKADKGLLAFDTETGDLKWSAPAGDHSYSSPALMTIAGQKVIAMLTNQELNLLNPTDGKVLLNYKNEIEGYRALQPQRLEDDSILIASGMGKGIQKIHVTNSNGQWEAEQVWDSPRLKPDFNDYVVYQGHAYGFDSTIFVCFDLKDGKRKWKGGRYGKGQVLLLRDSGQLLVISEQGDVVLLKADPNGHTELAKFHAIEGKTWNHPVLIGDQLFVRNSEQAASFRLPLAK
ncbi:MAG: PQQ-binding-like beta-propeller repeat protein [Gimesia sp.]|nr:PQQ-binding-like beta-propeller repeat protein [Gimesia sp.]